MAEQPTIDEMIEWLEQATTVDYKDFDDITLHKELRDEQMQKAIRAILERLNQPVPYPDVICPECGTGFSKEGWKARFE